MSFASSKSLRCLLSFSVAIQDGPDQRAVDGEACNPLIDEACAPSDMTFYAMRSIKIYLTYFSTTLRLLDMQTLDQMFRIGGQMLKVRRIGGEVSISMVQKKLVRCGIG
jgi:hypothetical protein